MEAANTGDTDGSQAINGFYTSDSARSFSMSPAFAHVAIVINIEAVNCTSVKASMLRPRFHADSVRALSSKSFF
jgi:hypothetical protein